MSSSIIALRLVVRRTLQCFIVWNQFVSQKEHQTGNWWDPYKLLNPIPSYHKTFTPKLYAKALFFSEFVAVGNDSGTEAERNGFVCCSQRWLLKWEFSMEGPDFLVFIFLQNPLFFSYYLHYGKHTILPMGIFHLIVVRENELWNYGSNLFDYLLENKVLYYKQFLHPPI